MISQFIVSLTLKRINRKFGTDVHKKLESLLLSAKYIILGISNKGIFRMQCN